MPQGRTVAPAGPVRSHIATWSCSTPSTCLKLPIATSLEPSGETSSRDTPTAALALPAGEAVVQLWFTVTELDRYGSSAPVEASSVARPPCRTPPTVVKAPPTYRRVPKRLTVWTLARSIVGGRKLVTWEPSATLSRVRPLTAAPFTPLKIPPT